MYTYQDLLAVGTEEKSRMEFIISAVTAHKNSQMYEDAVIAQEYDKKKNVTIIEYQKLLYKVSGEVIPDNYNANYKLKSNFFNRFVTQQNQYLLGNGVSFSEVLTKDKLGKKFDTRLQSAGRNALVDGVSFGFWNHDHLEVFRLTEFVPFWDEEDGGLKAGIRFWQIDKQKPFRATLYELDGYTEYIWRDGEGEVLLPKRKYVLSVLTSPVGDLEIIDGQNYHSFPIVPLWGNPAHQSELVGIREQIDCYDLIKSGFANDVDDASQIYWTINNAGGMDDVDLAQFVERMRTVKAAVVDDDGARAEQHSMDVPFTSRETLLERLRSDLYDDFMALDTKNIAGGAVTATQIKAAYEPVNNKADLYEYQVLDFMDSILELAGIDDDPTFTRSIIVNAEESIQTILQAATFLSEGYVVRKVLEILGDADKYDEVMAERMENQMAQAALMMDEEEANETDGSDSAAGGEENQEGV